MKVLWYASQSKLGRLIKWVTRSDYTHVAIVINGALYEALGTGIVRLEGEPAAIRATQAAASCELFATPEDRAQAQRWIEARVANRYNYAGFIAAGIGTVTRWKIVIALDGRYICSGLVAQTIEIAGIWIEGETRLQTPESLAKQLRPTIHSDVG